MIIVRPLTLKDLAIFSEFGFESILGMTNLPRDRKKLEEKIALSENSFKSHVEIPGKEEYYFVMEEISSGRLGGVCGILARNSSSLSYFYQMDTIPNFARHHAAPKEFKLLTAVTSSSHATEVCSLYLLPSFRHSGLGRLLSLSRFLFISGHRHRFEKIVYAEMRGYIDKEQSSPFWEAIGHHFSNLSFVEVMTLLDQDRTFIEEILPKYPIYIDLLPKEAQAVIGKTHDSTKPALNMLEEEGFSFSGGIDIFDGGPLYSCATGEIRTIAESSIMTMQVSSEPISSDFEYILCNDKIDFKACFGKIEFSDNTHGVIQDTVAEALGVKSGDKIRYVTLHRRL